MCAHTQNKYSFFTHLQHVITMCANTRNLYFVYLCFVFNEKTSRFTINEGVRMNKRVRIKDVAKRAGISVGTVDRVIHKRGRVAPDVKQKVLAVMKELGFQRNPIASALARNESYVVAVLLPDYNEDPYWEQPFAGVEKARKQIEHFGITVEYHFFELLNPKDFHKKATEVLATKPKAVLFPPLFLKEGQWFLNECDKAKIPCVSINTNIPGSKSLSYIGQDSYQSGVLAARLMNFGASPNGTAIIIDFSRGAPNAKHLVEKKEGFNDYFKAHPENEIQILTMVMEDFNDKKKLKIFMAEIIRKHPNLTGMFFTNSRAYKAIECMSDEVIQKIKIIGFDLIDKNLIYLAEDKINFLINQNPIEQGFLGLQTLYKHLIQHEDIDPIQYLPLDIVVKENVQYYQKRGYQMAPNPS